MLSKTSLKKNLNVFLFFLCYFLIGLWIHGDYGISWDEPVSRKNGLINVKYIGEKIAPFLLTQTVSQQPELEKWHDKDYGPAFEIPLAISEQLFNLNTTKEIYQFRHLATFIFSLFGAFAIYSISKSALWIIESDC